MTVVRPFRALRYDPARVDLSRVIVPPYDVIADDERSAFFDRDPHNAIRLELTRDAGDEAGTDYAHVAEIVRAWRGEGVLRRDEGPAFYVMRQSFKAPDGSALERTGFFAALRLEDYAARVVRPHERTLAGPKADRLKMLRATRANLSSVFLLYEDRESALEAGLAAALQGDETALARDAAGVEYSLAPLRDPAKVGAIEAFLAGRPVVIADGHHRYETALAYRDEQRAAHPAEGGAAWDSTLAFFANAYAPGSLLLPIHRVVKSRPSPAHENWARELSGWRVRELPAVGAESITGVLAEELAPLALHPSFVADDGESLRLWWRDEPLGSELMVRVLERDVLGSVFELDTEAIRSGEVGFPKSAERAARDVREGGGRVALYLNPLTPDDVFRATRDGEVMPQKSTFFYPKVPTGLVLLTHEEEGA